MNMRSFASPLAFALMAALGLSSCGSMDHDSHDGPGGDAVLTNQPLTLAERDALSPDQVIAKMMAGNERFVAGDLTPLNLQAARAASSEGQHPMAVVLSCLDSRVPVEKVFDQSIGDIFVGRVAGNVENMDQLGSMEFATAAAGARVVMVLGHEGCGAVKGACGGSSTGMANLDGLLRNIKPAIAAVRGVPAGERNGDNPAFVQKVVEANVIQTVRDIRQNSPKLREMEEAGTIKIIGAVYSLSTGRVTALDV